MTTTSLSAPVKEYKLSKINECLSFFIQGVKVEVTELDLDSFVIKKIPDLSNTEIQLYLNIVVQLNDNSSVELGNQLKIYIQDTRGKFNHDEETKEALKSFISWVQSDFVQSYLGLSNSLWNLKEGPRPIKDPSIGQVWLRRLPKIGKVVSISALAAVVCVSVDYYHVSWKNYGNVTLAYPVLGDQSRLADMVAKNSLMLATEKGNQQSIATQIDYTKTKRLREIATNKQAISQLQSAASQTHLFIGELRDEIDDLEGELSNIPAIDSLRRQQLGANILTSQRALRDQQANQLDISRQISALREAIKTLETQLPNKGWFLEGALLDSEGKKIAAKIKSIQDYLVPLQQQLQKVQGQIHSLRAYCTECKYAERIGDIIVPDSGGKQWFIIDIPTDKVAQVQQIRLIYNEEEYLIERWTQLPSDLASLEWYGTKKTKKARLSIEIPSQLSDITNGSFEAEVQVLRTWQKKIYNALPLLY